MDTVKTFSLDGNTLTSAERNLLIRYCLSVATRAKCSTRGLYRPFRQKDLRLAAEEQQRAHLARIKEYRRRAEAYDPAAGLPEDMLKAFDGVPSKAQFARYCREVVKQERDMLYTMKRLYSVYVDYAFIGKKLLAFHRSLNPRVTFGYSSVLHEECDFLLGEETRAAFLQSSLAELPQGEGDFMHDWGNVAFGHMELFYEDLTLFRGETCILETVSHEEMMTARLEEADLSALAKESGGRELAEKLQKL